MESNIHKFMSGFFISTVVIIGALGFSMVDYSTDKYGGDLLPPMVTTLETEDSFGVYFLGRGIEINTSVVNTAVGFIHRNHNFLIPAPIRIILQIDYGIELLSDKIKDIALEIQWRKNMGLPLFDDIQSLI